MPAIDDLIVDYDDVTDTFNGTENGNSTDGIDFNLDGQEVIGEKFPGTFFKFCISLSSRSDTPNMLLW